MVSFLISSRNGPRNGQKGMHQEWNDRNTHYLLLLLINFSEQSYYSKQLIVHGQIEHRQTPMLDLVSSTINNPSLPTTTIIENPASPPSPMATTSHDHQYPLLSALTTVTNHPSPWQHTPTTGTMRWQIHVTSAQRVDEHYAVSTAHGNDDVEHQQYVACHLDGDEASRWVAPTPFPLRKLLNTADGNNVAHQQCAGSSDSHDSTHQRTNSTTTHVYKPPNGAQSTTMANDHNDPKLNGCHGPQWPPRPTTTATTHNDLHRPWPLTNHTQKRPTPMTTNDLPWQLTQNNQHGHDHGQPRQATASDGGNNRQWLACHCRLLLLSFVILVACHFCSYLLHIVVIVVISVAWVLIS